jgi:hypothetical protein
MSRPRADQGHPYIALGTDRYRLIARIALSAVPVAAAINVLATRVAGELGTIVAAPSAIALFSAAFWLYDTRLWRLPPLDRLTRIPDLAGRWSGTVTLRAPGQPLDEHEAIECRVQIQQTWSHISIRFSTDRNASESLSAVLVPVGQGYVGLHYHYKVRWKDPSQSDHHGFQSLTPELDDSARSAQAWDHLRGDFYTDRHFLQYGELDLRRLVASAEHRSP